MKVALVYDRVTKFGGAERVLLALHQIWPDAPLYTAIYDQKKAPWAKAFTVIPSFLNKCSLIRRHHEWFANLMPFAFESFNFDKFDLIISVTSAEAKGIITKPHQLHINYLLTPTRYLWSHRHHYQQQGIIKYIRQPFMNALAKWDLIAATRPDKIIAISKIVANRCKEFYHRQVDEIIYPPVNTATFNIAEKPTDNGYFLIVSRLVSYKRVDLAIKACNQTGDTLIVVGSGSELSHLKHQANSNVVFKTNLSDPELAKLYQGAKALLFPQEEDFGIVAVEAQAAGIPVIAYQGGAAPEIVIPNQTGLLIKHQTTKDLVEAIQLLKSMTWYDKKIKEHANQFDQRVFEEKFRKYVETAWKQHQNACAQ